MGAYSRKPTQVEKCQIRRSKSQPIEKIVKPFRYEYSRERNIGFKKVQIYETARPNNKRSIIASEAE